MKKDEELLLSIRGVDLIAKEFIMHMKCYKDYIQVLSQSAYDEKEFLREAGDFNAVKNFIQNQVLCNNQAGSEHERSYRANLKKRILAEFGDALSFLSVNRSTPEVVMSTAGLDSATIVNDKDNILKLAAKFLREDLLNYASNLKDIDWPPNSKTLSSPEWQPPLSTSNFVTELLKAKDHDCSDIPQDTL